ncbi:uncharacterized protein LOC110235292 isoform X2 [Exaiptasia diaphana]|uniref:SAM domain-containing protein n=1 Tax=Exaiptasia diaphana TaxID=2652724 RepID=A0A913WZ74_EXADI|nr:uncharacterized protein LOC110235292 isoform X2 [Exaiptasia diaphana]
MSSGSKKNASLPQDNASENENLPKEVREWDTGDVVQWLHSKGIEEQIKKGFKDQKIDGLCLMEGLTDAELHSCNVITVGEKRGIKRQIAALVGNVRSVKVPKMAVKPKALNVEEKQDLLMRRRKVHRKIVDAFPGNQIPIFRGNASAMRRFEDAIGACKHLLNDAIGYDEEELRRHAKAILDERRRMVKHGYDYEDQGTSSTDNDVEVQENVSSKPISVKDSSEDKDDSEDDSSEDQSEDENKSLPTSLPGGVDNVPLSTAETILLSYFKKAYTKEIKKDVHLVPLCHKLKIKNAKAKDKNDLIIVLAKELLTQQIVILKKDANFFFLHKDSICVTKTFD